MVDDKGMNYEKDRRFSPYEQIAFKSLRSSKQIREIHYEGESKLGLLTQIYIEIIPADLNNELSKRRYFF